MRLSTLRLAQEALRAQQALGYQRGVQQRAGCIGSDVLAVRLGAIRVHVRMSLAERV